MDHAGIDNQAELAKQMSKWLGRSVDRTVPGKILSGSRDLGADEMLAIESITKYPVWSQFVSIQVPIIGWVAAGKLADPGESIPAEISEAIGVEGLTKRRQHFGLRVEGDSMNVVSPEGSVIIVQRGDTDPVHGADYVVLLDGETTYKRYFRDKPERFEPQSDNRAHKPIFINRRKQYEIIGRVVRTIVFQDR